MNQICKLPDKCASFKTTNLSFPFLNASKHYHLRTTTISASITKSKIKIIKKTVRELVPSVSEYRELENNGKTDASVIYRKLLLLLILFSFALFSFALLCSLPLSLSSLLSVLWLCTEQFFKKNKNRNLGLNFNFALIDSSTFYFHPCISNIINVNLLVAYYSNITPNH